MAKIYPLFMTKTSKKPHRLTNAGGFSQNNWVGVCVPLPKTLILFMTNISDFPYAIYELKK